MSITRPFQWMLISRQAKFLKTVPVPVLDDQVYHLRFEGDSDAFRSDAALRLGRSKPVHTYNSEQ